MIDTVLITTGDVDGIGLEVTCKALNKIRPQKNLRFICFYQNDGQKKFFRLVGSHFKKIFINSLDDLVKLKHKDHFLYLLQDNRSPALWVQDAAELCMQKRAQGIITAPLSKQEIKKSGLVDLGHTDILKRVSNVKSAFMCFIGKKFNVVLSTGHCPISSVSDNLTTENIVESSLLWGKLSKVLIPKSKLPIGILGLNPHAGDKGLIGSEDSLVVKPAIDKLTELGVNVAGPLIPDISFIDSKKFSAFICMYHDQGLIPFKMAHGFSGVHLTLGIPFWRTSVDHGTAKDLFGKNKANYQSMLDAIKLEIRLVRSSHV